MIFFTGDEHYGHTSRAGGIIKYCDRPFDNIVDHDEAIISNLNEVVDPRDTVIHNGDFSWRSVNRTIEIIKRLNGIHIFVVALRGGHDKVIRKISRRYPDLSECIPYIYELTLYNKYHITICHYKMEVWPRSHYNSWHCFAHSHCKLRSTGKSHDIGVDCNNFYPLSFDQLKDIMDAKPDNFNYIKNREEKDR